MHATTFQPEPKFATAMSQSVDKAVVLVIDDDADIVAGLAKVLSAAGYVAHCCRDAEAAMECVRKLTPDLIISDINLGGYSGLQLCERIRKEPGMADVPLMFLSGANPGHHPPLARSGRDLLPAQAIRPQRAAGTDRQSPLAAPPDRGPRKELSRGLQRLFPIEFQTAPAIAWAVFSFPVDSALGPC